MDKPVLVNLPEFLDNRGALTYVEEGKHIPFKIDSVYKMPLESSKITVPADAFIIVPGEKQGYIVPPGYQFDMHGYENEIIILSAAPVDEMEEKKLKTPFRIRRIYFITNIPQKQTRGSHAHRMTAQTIFAVKGAFSVTSDNGGKIKTEILVPDSKPVNIEAGIWHTLDNFTPDAICMVLASELYSDEDYIRDYDEFVDFRNMTMCND